MTFFEKDINTLEESDLQWLVDVEFSEASIVEYKARLDFGTNEEIEKVLSQIVSFANAKGGNLIYGIQAEKGIPKKLEGQPIADADGLILKIENVIRQNFRPQLSLYESRAVKISNGNYAVVFRIEQSWNRPHQFRFNNKYLFYSRSSNGRTQIDVEDLRNLFTGVAELKHRIEEFRAARISDLMAGNTPVGSIQFPIIALHFIPISNLAKELTYNPKVFSWEKDNLMPRSRYAFNGFFNFDGFVVMSNGEEGADFYIQGYRDLRMEKVLGEYQESPETKSQIIPQTRLANEIFMLVENAINFYKKANVELPIVLMLSILGVKDYKFKRNHNMFSNTGKPIDRNVMQFPSILISNYDVNIKQMLKPTLDIFWQSAGFLHCFDYNQNGDWIE